VVSTENAVASDTIAMPRCSHESAWFSCTGLVLLIVGFILGVAALWAIGVGLAAVGVPRQHRPPSGQAGFTTTPVMAC